MIGRSFFSDCDVDPGQLVKSDVMVADSQNERDYPSGGLAEGIHLLQEEVPRVVAVLHVVIVGEVPSEHYKIWGVLDSLPSQRG